jgi:ketosteroid isomerase-like protein
MSDAPRDVFLRLAHGIADGRWAELGDLYAEDTVVEHPQQPPSGLRTVGRKAVADRFTTMAGPIELKARDIVVHETTDPELIIAEYDYDGRIGDHTFSTANVQVLRVRDGLIVHSRDYHDHLRMAAALGGPAGFAEQYEQGVPSLPDTPELALSAPAESRRGVVERLLLGVTQGKGAETAELYAEDAYVTHPFHPSAPPLKGREELRAHFAPARGSGLTAHDLVTYEGLDPEMIVAEFTYAGRFARPLVVSNIFVTRVRNGLITESRDYGDHLAFAAATGGLADLLAAV